MLNLNRAGGEAGITLNLNRAGRRAGITLNLNRTGRRAGFLRPRRNPFAQHLRLMSGF